MRIVLDNIRLYAYHGVLAQEKKVGQWYTVNIRMDVRDESATYSDDLNDTVNYAVVYDIVRREMDVPSRLIEHVCGRIAHTILRECRLVDEVTVGVIKTNPPIGADCSGCGVELALKR